MAARLFGICMKRDMILNLVSISGIFPYAKSLGKTAETKWQLNFYTSFINSSHNFQKCTLFTLLKAERRSTEETSGLHSRPQKKYQWGRRVAPITPQQRPCPTIGLFATH